MNPETAEGIVREQNAFFITGATRELAFRIKQLRKLRAAIVAHESEIVAAARADMRRPEFETYTGEIALCLEEIDHAAKHIKTWARPQRVGTSIVHFWSTSRIHAEPLGVTLNIAPWNYPFQLCIAPLVSSMAAGNCMVVKPSELAPATSAVVAKLLSTTFDPRYVAAVEGGVETTQALLLQRFDHIFFTGGTGVGRIVMEAAARHLTPVTLELGGKSPCIVDAGYPIEQAARRIAWAKFFNAGQTCVAPDYVLAHRSVKPALLNALKAVVREFYGDDPSKSADYGRIINERHFMRLAGLLRQGNIVAGGQTDAAQRYIAPTIVDKVSLEDPVMAEEIFGPILPVLEYETLDQAIEVVRQRPKPLSLYLFTTDRAHEARVVRDLPFGGGCINDCLIHLSSPDLPFGGVGPSGMGAYHGKAGFDVFSHRKSVVKKTALFDLKLRYAPYTRAKLRLAKRLLG